MSDIEQHFVQTITQKQSYEEAKNPQTFFPPAQETHTLQFLSCQQKKLWEDLFSHREGDGLLYKIPDSCSAFQEVFTLYHLFVCV